MTVRRVAIHAALLVAASLTQADAADAPEHYAGINLPTAAFGETAIPGTYAKDYIYPEPSTIAYFAGEGMNVLRLAVLWERLQHTLKGELDEDEMARIDSVIESARANGMRVILDVHNYARYRGKIIGPRGVPPAALGDLWGRLAARYKDDDTVIFNIMNEPNGLPTEIWLRAANEAAAAIRNAGAGNLILVPGNGWSSARDWTSSSYGTPNSEAMLGFEDPAGNYAYDVHQYFDSDFTGTSGDCQSTEVAVASLTPVTDWARQHGKRLFLGEFGVGRNLACLDLLDRVMRLLSDNEEVWIGWTYWAAGQWWPADYYTNIQPVSGEERPQLSVLRKYLSAPLTAPD
jgi:endoglucanase